MLHGVIMCASPQVITLAMITMRKSIHGFPFFFSGSFFVKHTHFKTGEQKPYPILDHNH